jgi:hypothetical protein
MRLTTLGDLFGMTGADVFIWTQLVQCFISLEIPSILCLAR